MSQMDDRQKCTSGEGLMFLDHSPLADFSVVNKYAIGHILFKKTSLYILLVSSTAVTVNNLVNEISISGDPSFLICSNNKLTIGAPLHYNQYLINKYFPFYNIPTIEPLCLLNLFRPVFLFIFLSKL